MSDQPADVPPHAAEITASVTVAGSQATLLRDLAAVLGRTPESLAIEWAAGALPLPSESTGEDPRVPEWGLFDGPPDLSVRADEHVREGFSQ
ncbi:hypothetical protein H1V43_18105 [Streptomyces sp. PSKA54]|uniref:Uncharacterized protein n=1 Tax=Streptomyces himalayensis subsp. aureolus TaxID=2758039 RepID=A0A7W2D1W6_9ACTN|nr:hypothetical protein [Streptomyces himalayensis]MBA4863262.1 hypothetical protein [Streptomyces himalayensis subsp. aureolus]